VLHIPNRHNNQFTAVSVEGLLRLSNLSSRYRDISLPRKRNAGFTYVGPVEVALSVYRGGVEDVGRRQVTVLICVQLI
jgi:hypothetical protein